jgi:transposase-like protein
MRNGGYQSIQGFIEFTDRFSSEDACRRFLFSRRWPDGYACPRCGSVRYTIVLTRELYQCRDCRYQVSLTAGTIMEKTRTPLRAWLWMMFLMANQKTGVSVLGAARMIGISYKRASLMAHKIRIAMASRDSNYRLAGVVEMDDSYFGGKGKPGKRGRGAAGKTPVLVCVSVEDGKPGYASMKALSGVTVSEIKDAAIELLDPKATVVTDGFLTYTLSLTSYKHKVKVIGDPKLVARKLPWVHILIANAKAMIRGVHHGVPPAHLQEHLSEFCWRFSRRGHSDELFDRLLYACIAASP